MHGTETILKEKMEIPKKDKLRLEFIFRNLKRGNLLDVGNLGGSGYLHRIFIKGFPDSEIYGLDLFESNEFPRQKVGNFEEMPYPNGFFDSIFMGQVFEHTWKPKQVLEECFRILKPSGVLILDTPNVYSLSRVVYYLLKGTDVIRGNPDHKLFYSRAMLTHLLEDSGFQIKEMTTEQTFTRRGLILKMPFKWLGEILLVAAVKN